MDGGQGRARLRDDDVVQGRHLPNGAHALGGEQHLARRDLTADQAGVAALGRHRDPVLGAAADDGGHFGGGPRQQQQRRGAPPAIAPLAQLGRRAVGVVRPSVRAHQALQGGDRAGQGVVGHSGL